MIRKITLRELRARIRTHLIESEHDVTSQLPAAGDDPAEFGSSTSGETLPGEEESEGFPEEEPEDVLQEKLANAFRGAKDEGMLLQDIANIVADMLSDEMRFGSDIHSVRDAFDSWYASRSQLG